MNTLPRHPLRAHWQHLILAAILVTPSVWMLATVPPLWRDSDAYNQLTQHPALATVWGHGPLYCLTARVPLYLGYAIERCHGPILPQTAQSLGNSGLTETGIIFLIIAQHLALCVAAVVFIKAAARAFILRILLALAFASVPIFYAFAHCVGSETLSMILLLLFATAALRIVRSPEEASLQTYYSVALLLYLLLLTRYINFLLVFVLPIALLFLALRRRPKARAATAAVITFALGLVALGMARQSMSDIAHWKKFEYHARPGFTFLWRLKFVSALPETERAAVLDRVAARVRSEDAKKIVALLRESLRDGATAQPLALYDAIAPALFPPDTKEKAAIRKRRQDEAMNEVARAFLSPPTAPHWRSAWRDFTAARSWPCGEIVRYLFETTAYIVPRLDEMPELARLSTFQGATTTSLLTIPERNVYLRFWADVPLDLLLALAASSILVLLLSRRGIAVATFSATITLVGCAMIFTTCLVGAMIQRYTLPLWELSFIALALCIGALSEKHSRHDVALGL